MEHTLPNYLKLNKKEEKALTKWKIPFKYLAWGLLTGLLLFLIIYLIFK